MTNAPIKIKTFGWQNGILGQISMINEGLKNIGIELSDEEPNILYKNEDFYDEVIEFTNKCKKKPFCIFNILDLQLGNPRYDLNKLKEQLLFADAITCISETVKKEIKQYLDLDAVNIGNPIRDITYNPEIKKEIDFLIVGRNSDPNKRATIFESLLWNNSGRTFAVAGPEPLPHIRDGYLGVLKNHELNEIYNMSKFVICCSKREGLLLTIPEACCGGAIPLIASDMSTAKEWDLPTFTVEPNVESINNKVKELENDYKFYQEIALSYGNGFREKFNKNQIAKNILEVYLKNS